MIRLFADTETGGTDPLTNSLLTVGLVAYDDREKRVLASTQVRVKDNLYRCDAKALEVNGIDLEVHDALALPKDAACREIYRFVKDHINDGRKLGWKKPRVHGHNIHFDLRFLTQLFIDAGVPEHNPFGDYAVMDTLPLTIFLQEHGLIPVTPKHKLGILLREYGLLNESEQSGLHDAEFDTLQTVKLWEFLTNAVEAK